METSQNPSCESCGRIFSHKCNLYRHLKRCYIMNSSFKCELCSKEYSREGNLKSHIKNVHQNTTEQIYICASCDKVFNKRASLVHHINVTGDHDIFECYHCSKKFRIKTNLIKHIRFCSIRLKKAKSNVNRFRCAVCSLLFDTKIRINEHYGDVHGIQLEIESLTQNSFDEFDVWKSNVQRETITHFIKQASKESKCYCKKLFVCHRSSISRAIPRRATTNKFPKRNGSKKLECFCPAQIEVRIYKADGRCSVRYTKTHVGHSSKDRRELRHIYLTKEQRTRLVARLKDDISRSEIRKQEMLLKNKDVGSWMSVGGSATHDGNAPNVSYVFDERAAFKEDFGVNTFVENNRASVLYYKHQLSVDSKSYKVKKVDFELVLMNEAQEKHLRTYGANVVCFDRTDGADKNGYLLHTLLVSDVDREGYPAAFFVTNRSDDDAIDVFVQSVKDRVGNIRAKVVMSDLHDSYYQSWTRIMDSTPEFHLYCTWHVDEAWRRTLPVAPKSRNCVPQVKRRLYSLCYESNPYRFEQKMADFLSIDDVDVEDFMRYFRNNFAEKTYRWAHCYRQYAGVNVNMSLESFHKRIKRQLTTNDSNANWLPRVFKSIKEYMEAKAEEEEIKSTYGVDYAKLKNLRKAHHKARKRCENKNFDELMLAIDDHIFYVQSFTNDDVNYFVSKQPEPKECVRYAGVTCSLRCQLCDLCFHEYFCTCSQNTIRSCMCEHIHVVGMYKQSTRKAAV